MGLWEETDNCSALYSQRVIAVLSMVCGSLLEVMKLNMVQNCKCANKWVLSCSASAGPKLSSILSWIPTASSSRPDVLIPAPPFCFPLFVSDFAGGRGHNFLCLPPPHHAYHSSDPMPRFSLFPSKWPTRPLSAVSHNLWHTLLPFFSRVLKHFSVFSFPLATPLPSNMHRPPLPSLVATRATFLIPRFFWELL